MTRPGLVWSQISKIPDYTTALNSMSVGDPLWLNTIISGGQTGADQAGLEIARHLGLQTGGWAPRGYRTEDGPALWLKDYGLLEHKSPEYPPRTILNVQNAGGTVWFGNHHSPGGRLTITTARSLGKPCAVNPTAEELRRWLIKDQIQVLNVAGNRASTNPRVRVVVSATISLAVAGKEIVLEAVGEPR